MKIIPSLPSTSFDDFVLRLRQADSTLTRHAHRFRQVMHGSGREMEVSRLYAMSKTRH